MSTTSVVMQPARAAPSASTGDGPAVPVLSSVSDALLAVAENLRSPIQVRSTIVGGLVTLQHRPLREDRFCEEPSERQNHEQIRQEVTERAIGTPGLGSRVDDFAVGEIVLLRHFVRALNDQLHDEDEQENRRHLKG